MANRGCRKRKLTFKIPNCVATRPFEFFMAYIGILGTLPVVFRLDNSNHVYENFPGFIPYLWIVLMVTGGLRTIYGLKEEDRGHISAGSLMVSYMVMTYALATMVNTGGTGGWTLLIASIAMVIISNVRSLHMKAVEKELRKVVVT